MHIHTHSQAQMLSLLQMTKKKKNDGGHRFMYQLWSPEDSCVLTSLGGMSWLQVFVSPARMSVPRKTLSGLGFVVKIFMPPWFGAPMPVGLIDNCRLLREKKGNSQAVSSLMCKSPCKCFFRATVNMKNEALQTWPWVTHPLLPAYLYMFGTSNTECHYLFNKQMLFEKWDLMHFNIPCPWILEQCGAWQRLCCLNLGLFSSVQWEGLLLLYLSDLSLLQVMKL